MCQKPKEEGVFSVLVQFGKEKLQDGQGFKQGSQRSSVIATVTEGSEGIRRAIAFAK
jgi:hypothetical protein